MKTKIDCHNSSRILFPRTSAALTTLIFFSVAASFTLLLPFSAGAATITWGTPTTISADTDVSTAGTLNRAFNFGSPNPPSVPATTINTVTFAAFAVSGTSTTVGNTTLSTSGAMGATSELGFAAAPFSGLSSEYQALLANGAFGNPADTLTLTLNGLTVGTQYQVQYWVNDSRASAASNRQTVVTAGNAVTLEHNSQNADGGTGQFVVGTFVADSTSQIISITGASTGPPGAAPQINGVQLRRAGPVVTNTDNSGPGSLRQALADAIDGDIITFDIASETRPNAPAVTTVITLTSGELVVNNNVTIDGPGADVLEVTRDNSAPAFRIFNVTAGHTVTIEGLTISGGVASGSAPAFYGGGVYNDNSTLTLDGCAINGNAAVFGAAVFNDGSTNNSASVTIVNSTLSGNDASVSGGGIYNDGNLHPATATINNTTFSGNSADGAGGAIVNDSGAGSTATLFLANSTVSNNTSPGGGGIRIFDNAVVHIGNTILKRGATGVNLVGGAINSAGYNLSDDNGSGFLDATGDQINADPMLGALQNNGGTTFTHAPVINSPAIDQGKRDTIAALTTDFDQRGIARPVNDPAVTNAAGGDGSDIGAVEVQSFVHPTGATSLKTHGAAGPLPISLPLTGTPGVECRSGGATGVYQMIVTFSEDTLIFDAQVTSGTGSVSNISSSNPNRAPRLGTKNPTRPDGAGGTQFTIDLTGVTNAQTITVTLFAVSNSSGFADVGIRMSLLLGDVNGTGDVNSTDIAEVKSQSGQVVGAANFRSDVNANGVINATDVSTVKLKSGSSLP